MKCPLSGKPCLMPKEIFVTEIREDGVKHLFLCRKCGEQYIENNLQNVDLVTKAMEVMATNGGDIMHSEHIQDQNEELLTDSYNELELLLNEQEPPPEEVPLLPQIKKAEAKLQEAIDKEDYESAGQLRDILEELKKKLDESEPEAE